MTSWLQQERTRPPLLPLLLVGGVVAVGVGVGVGADVGARVAGLEMEREKVLGFCMLVTCVFGAGRAVGHARTVSCQLKRFIACSESLLVTRMLAHTGHTMQFASYTTKLWVAMQ